MSAATAAAARAMRVVIVDDEGLARRGIRARLARESDVSVVAEGRDVEEGVAAVRTHRPDLVFLDIEMPGADGFSLVERFPEPERPLIVFVTAHDDRALRAFEVQAFDYVLKPIDDRRFARVVARVRERLRERAPAGDVRLVIRDRGRQVVVPASAIDWVQSDGDYVRIYAGREHYLHHATLRAMMAELPADRFARIHRSTIVNGERVRAVEPLTNGDHDVILTTGARLRASRTHREALLGILGRRG